MNELVQSAVDSLPRYKTEPDGSYEQAYHCLQNSADRMPDDLFMFEAGRRSGRLEYEKGVLTRITKAVKTTLTKEFEKMKKELEKCQ